MSDATGIKINTIYRWTYAKDKHNGTDGVIPLKWHDAILKGAADVGVDINREDLVL